MVYAVKEYSAARAVGNRTPKMKPCRQCAASTDATILRTLRLWLETTGEILVLLRYSRAAGKKSFELFGSFGILRERLGQLPAETSVIAFRRQQLPIRGIVDDELIRECLENIPDGSEFVVLETVKRSSERFTWFHHEAGESHTELRDALEECRGKSVAVGKYPPWLEEGPDVISAIVPNQNGTITSGVY